MNRHHAHRASATTEIPEYKLAVNQQPTKPNVALFEAAAKGDLNTVKQSLSAGGSPNYFVNPEEGAAALHKACEGGHAAVIKALLAGGSVLEERLLTSHNAPLHIACIGSHLDAAEVLLAAGASVNIGNAFGNSPLHACIMADKPSLALLKLLLGKGSDATWTNNRLSTPVHFVAYSSFAPSQKIAACDLLTAAGAGLNAADDEGMTALHIAARDGDESLAKYLVDHGAREAAKDGQGNTPRWYANYKGHESIAKLLA